jgi:hypothetical protein
LQDAGQGFAPLAGFEFFLFGGITMKNLRLSLSVLVALPLFLAAQTKPANVSGKWQLSWEARIGTERDTIQLEQSESKLSGTFQGKPGSPQGKSGSPKVSGNVDGTRVALQLDFPGPQPYTLLFIGTINGDKMSGNLEVPGVDKAYDWHGENVRPTNYTWSAIRQLDTHPPDQESANSTQLSHSNVASKPTN